MQGASTLQKTLSPERGLSCRLGLLRTRRAYAAFHIGPRATPSAQVPCGSRQSTYTLYNHFAKGAKGIAVHFGELV